MKKIFLAIILVPLLAFGCAKKTQNPADSKSQGIIPDALQEKNKNQPWQDYNNSNYGFSLKYPGFAKSLEKAGDGKVLIFSTTVGPLDSLGSVFSVSVEKKRQTLDCKTFPGGADLDSAQAGGLTIKKCSYDSSGNNYEKLLYGEVSNNNYTYTFFGQNYNLNSEIIDRIISGFKLN